MIHASCVIPAASKGFALLGRIPVEELNGLRLNVFGPHPIVTLPLMILRADALEHNIATMAVWCAEQGVSLAPHAKTTMAPRIWRAQLRAGAWGLTAATVDQAAACISAEANRVLLASPLVDPAGIRWLARVLARDPTLEVVCYVDSVAGVRLLADELRRCCFAGELPVLVELGFPGGRTGARGVDEALLVAKTAADTRILRVVGASTYEGVIGGERTPEQLAQVHALCESLRELGDRLVDSGIARPPIILSAGGSLYFDVVATTLNGPASTVLLRSGGYVTHDHGHLGSLSPLAGRFRPAIEVWSHVLSRPEPSLAFLGAGKRDLAFDVAPPTVLSARSPAGLLRRLDDAIVAALNDQHAYVRLPPESDLDVGDVVRLGVAHPCAAFDRWRLIPVLDETDHISDVIFTLF
ncbi:alanine racemase [Nonomuraea sp. H19]|uniref:alanine racemase n=1 Tax=Nonomuraea sp. H19 TaxID=3452206 RepID=UPI003F8AAD78